MNKQLKMVIDWARELGINKMYIKKNEGKTNELRFSLFTAKHEYKIVAHPKGKSKSYLGCIVYNRSPEPGEEHVRCSDLADGRLSKETWEQIKNDIIATELLPIVDIVDRPVFNGLLNQ